MVSIIGDPGEVSGAGGKKAERCDEATMTANRKNNISIGIRALCWRPGTTREQEKISNKSVVLVVCFCHHSCALSLLCSPWRITATSPESLELRISFRGMDPPQKTPAYVSLGRKGVATQKNVIDTQEQWQRPDNKMRTTTTTTRESNKTKEKGGMGRLL